MVKSWYILLPSIIMLTLYPIRGVCWSLSLVYIGKGREYTLYRSPAHHRTCVHALTPTPVILTRTMG